MLRGIRLLRVQSLDVGVGLKPCSREWRECRVEARTLAVHDIGNDGDDR